MSITIEKFHNSLRKIVVDYLNETDKKIINNTAIMYQDETFRQLRYIIHRTIKKHSLSIVELIYFPKAKFIKLIQIEMNKRYDHLASLFFLDQEHRQQYTKLLREFSNLVIGYYLHEALSEFERDFIYTVSKYQKIDNITADQLLYIHHTPLQILDNNNYMHSQFTTKIYRYISDLRDRLKMKMASSISENEQVLIILCKYYLIDILGRYPKDLPMFYGKYSYIIIIINEIIEKFLPKIEKK